MGLDPSWQAGLYMALHNGLHAGTQVVFTYGPLGFLDAPGVWYAGLGAIAFAYQALLLLALAVALVWALSRSLHVVLAAVIVALVLIGSTEIDLEIALTTILCVAALGPRAPRSLGWIVTWGGGILGALGTLVLLRTGPVVLVMSLITVLALDRRRLRVATLCGCAIVTFLIAWFASGQGVGNITAYASNAAQIVGGFGQAMSNGTAQTKRLVEIIVLALALPAIALAGGTGRRRWVACVVVLIASVTLYKESIVRQDSGHVALFVSTAAVIGLGLWQRRNWQPAAAVAIAMVAIVATGPLSSYRHFQLHQLNPVMHAHTLVSQIDAVTSSHDRSLGRFDMELAYDLDGRVLAALHGHTVDIDPWEIAIAWAYQLNWHPTPVIQNYSAYTPALDRLNADALRSGSAPQRILRENINLDNQSQTGDVNARLESWDPPEQTIAMLCNYVPLITERRWQVLAKSTDRCGASTLVRTISVRNDEKIPLPAPGPGMLTYARIDGAQTIRSRVRALLYRGAMLHISTNSGALHELVPATATDGLLLDLSPQLDYPAPFAVAPQARTLTLFDLPGSIRISVYEMPIAPAE